MNFAQYLATPVKPLFDPQESTGKKRVVTSRMRAAATRREAEDKQYREAIAELGGRVTNADISKHTGISLKTVTAKMRDLAQRKMVVRYGTLVVRGGKAAIWKWAN